jgi:HK97 family phage prohead protease
MSNEQRIFQASEFRASSDGKTITGVAAAYGVLSGPIPAGAGSSRTFREKISPGAFKRAVDGKQDVVMLVNHDPKQLLGRTSSGTLELTDTPHGLSFRCSMPDTQVGRDTREMISRGDLRACSFGFGLTAGDDEWSECDEDDIDPSLRGKQKRKVIVRTIRNVSRLDDVSVVTRPAYDHGTSVGVRAAIPAEIRSKFFPEVEDLAEKAWNEFTQGVTDTRARRKNLLNSILNS